jgi:hypothetical protein
VFGEQGLDDRGRVHTSRRPLFAPGDFLLRMRGASQDAITGEHTRYRAERAAGNPTC